MNIKMEQFKKVISGNLILDDISLEFSSGHIYGLIGKNGSGKTMLMRAIAGLISPTSGTVKINDKILGKDISFPESIGILIENPGFISGYSGFKNLKFLAQIKNEIGDDTIRNTLSLVGLDPDDKRSFRKFSLGMKQKLGIAAAIMENPDIVIFDEPFNALDEETSKIIEQIILSMRSNERIIILACHDKDEIESLCDITIKIDSGKITAER